MRFITFLLLTFPVFSLTNLIGLPRLHNVALAILLVGSFELLSKRIIKLNPILIYSWSIAFGIGLSNGLRLIFEGESTGLEWTFPLIWLLLPFFLSSWERFTSTKDFAKFTEVFFFINFVYSLVQIVVSRVLGYSLVVHILFSEYKIVTFSQDTPFSYLGLNDIHAFVSDNLGAAATGLVIERVDLMIICIICILRMNPFNYQNNYKIKNKIVLLLYRTNIILAIILLTVCGSSLSIFIVLLPFLYVIAYPNTKLSLHVRGLKLSKIYGSLALVVVLIFATTIVLFFFFASLTEIIKDFDSSERISGLLQFSTVLSERFSDNFSEFIYGSGLITTETIGLNLATQELSLIPRSLDVFGYTFNSFGLVGLVPFLSCYPLLLSSQTSLKWPSILVFCLLVFSASGSPLTYSYTYSLILSRQNRITTDSYTSKSEIPHG